MDHDDLPRQRGDAASRLSGENLDSYSQAELQERIAQLEAEILRVKARYGQAASDRQAAEALFGKRDAG